MPFPTTRRESLLPLTMVKTSRPRALRWVTVNSALSDALHPVPNFTVRDWEWVYIPAATIRQAKTDTAA